MKSEGAERAVIEEGIQYAQINSSSLMVLVLHAQLPQSQVEVLAVGLTLEPFLGARLTMAGGRIEPFTVKRFCK